MKKKIDPEVEFLKLLSNEDARKYELLINNKCSTSMYYIFWAAVSREYKKMKFVDDLPEDTLYIMKEVE